MSRDVQLYIAMSLDGYIATQDDNIDFLSQVEMENEDYGYADFTQQIDTVIWGRRTYDKVMTFDGEFLHTGRKVYVISRSRTGETEHVTYHPDVIELVRQLKSEAGKNIYCDGGAEIIFELLRHQLIDRIIVSIIPHLLGDGIPLFKAGFSEQKITLKRSITYPSGLVQLWYDVRKENQPEAGEN